MSKKYGQRLVFRYVHLSRRKAKNVTNDTTSFDETFPPLHELMETVWRDLPTVGSRHVPRLDGEKPSVGTRYIVPIKYAKHEGTGAVLIRFCIYTGGEQSGFAPSDLTAGEASVSYSQVTDEQGNILSPGAEFSALMFGRVLLIQNRQGIGAEKMVRRALLTYGKQTCSKSLLLPEFVAVATKDAMQAIENAGGVTSLSFGMADQTPVAGVVCPLNELGALRDRVSGDSIRTTIRAAPDSTLDAVEALKLLEEPEEDGLERVVLRLGNSETLTADKIAVSKVVSVSMRNGVPNCDEVDRELLGFLMELMRIDASGHQCVTHDGRIGSSLQLVELKVKA